MSFKKFLIIFFSLSLLTWRADCCYAEMRAMWVTRSQMDSPVKIENFVKKAKDNGINTLFVQVLGRGMAYYDSSILPEVDTGFDPLKLAVEKSHNAGIKVHAWMNTYYIWSNSEPPLQEGHIANKFPDWLLEEGVSKYIDPSSDTAREYLVNVFCEVAENYDVDGIHMDYVRYPSEVSALNYRNRRMFSDQYWIDPSFIVRSPNSVKTYYGKSGFEEMDQRWIEFRCKNVSRLVEEVSVRIKLIKPGIELSAAVYPDIDVAKREKGQDWSLWLKMRFVDFVVPMVYSEKLDRFTRMVRKIVSISDGDKIIIGMGAYMGTASQIADQIRTYRRFQKYYSILGGFCLFSYDSMSNWPYYLEKLKKYAF